MHMRVMRNKKIIFIMHIIMVMHNNNIMNIVHNTIMHNNVKNVHNTFMHMYTNNIIVIYL